MALCLLQQKPLHCQLNVHMLNIKKKIIIFLLEVLYSGCMCGN